MAIAPNVAAGVAWIGTGERRAPLKPWLLREETESASESEPSM